jgi:uncharacterized protein YhjY with autotransporter beta-barrel domain
MARIAAMTGEALSLLRIAKFDPTNQRGIPMKMNPMKKANAAGGSCFVRWATCAVLATQLMATGSLWADVPIVDQTGLPNNAGVFLNVENTTAGSANITFDDFTTTQAYHLTTATFLGPFVGANPTTGYFARIDTVPDFTLTPLIQVAGANVNGDLHFNFGGALLNPGTYWIAAYASGPTAVFFQRASFDIVGQLPLQQSILTGFGAVSVPGDRSPLFSLFGNPVTGPSGHAAPDEPAPVLLTDAGAINSLLTTGLLMPAVQRQAVQNAASGAIRDLNSRLFRARTQGASGGDSFASTMDSSTVRYLNFAANQNIDYRVALGLRDGVEVEYQHDSMALGDTFWATSPFALSGGPVILAAAPIFTTKAVIAAPAGASSGGKETFDDKVAIENPAYKRFETFAEFDYGFYDQDSLTNLVRGFDSDTYAGSAGLEYRLFPWLHVGAAFTYLQSDTELSSNLGGVDLDGTMLSGYFTAFWKQLYLDVLYSYGDFNNEVSRNTLLGRTAQGDTDSYAHNIDINLGHNYALSDQITAGPYAGFNYSTGGIDAYTETGGGTANVAYGADDYESMIGRLGWQVSYATDTPVGKVIVQGRANWAHQFMPEADTIQASLATSPFILVNGSSAHRVGGFAAESDSAHAGQDWLELGAGLRLDLDESWNVQLDYEGQFARNNASAHFAALKLEYEWDTVFLPGLGGKDVIATTADAPKAKGAGLKSLLAGKSSRSAAPAVANVESTPAVVAAPVAPAVEKEEATPFAEAKPVAVVAPAKPTRSAPASSGNTADQPKIYNSWDEVPGREKVKATIPAAVTPEAKPQPKEAAAEPVKQPVVALPETAPAPVEVKTGAVSEPVASAN